MKVYSLTVAHAAVDAQKRMTAAKKELDDLKANFPGRLSTAKDDH